MSRGLTGAFLGLLLSTCAHSADPSEFELASVVAPAIAELERSIDAQAAAVSPSAGGDSGDTPLAAEQLLSVVENSPAPALRREAVVSLLDQQDQVVPALLARIRREPDEETVIAIGATLAWFGNFSAVERLRALALRSPDGRVREKARAVLLTAAFAPAVGDAETVARLWNAGDPAQRLPPARVSDRQRLCVWERIRDLAAADPERAADAQAALEGGAAWTSELLARALHERDPATRIAVARCISGMGPRGLAAGPSLVAGLADPALAPECALALGDIGFASAIGELERRLASDHPLALRVAAARAIGRMHLAQGIAPLRAVFTAEKAGQPLELRQTAAQALVVLGRGDEVARFLVECLTSPTADRDAAERALEYWLEHPDAPSPGNAALLKGWRALAGPPGIEPDESDVRQRREARAELLRRAMPH
jgi:HEAT repeat protein